MDLQSNGSWPQANGEGAGSGGHRPRGAQERAVGCVSAGAAAVLHTAAVTVALTQAHQRPQQWVTPDTHPAMSLLVPGERRIASGSNLAGVCQGSLAPSITPRARPASPCTDTPQQTGLKV